MTGRAEPPNRLEAIRLFPNHNTSNSASCCQVIVCLPQAVDGTTARSPYTLGMLIDTHLHLTHRRFADDLPAVIAQARAAGVRRMLTIGTGIQDTQAALKIRAAFPDTVFCAAGLDPFSCHEARAHIANDFAELERLLAAGQLLAVGEFGLEYHHRDTVPTHTDQQEFCTRQLELCRRFDLPAILHVRDAHHDMLPLLARHHGVRGVVHSFSGDAATARRYLDLGWHLSFNGMITYKGNDALRDAVRLTPADRLLVETDAPYLSPIPHRGQRCTPALVAVTANVIAELRGERPEDLAAWTTRNATLLFRLPPITES